MIPWSRPPTVRPSDLVQLRDATNKLAAIDEYLSRTSIEGRARVAAAVRRLEVRIGQLLPREQGRRTDQLPPRAEEVLRDQRRAEFRQMAANPEKVEEIIAASTDEQPAAARPLACRASHDRIAAGQRHRVNGMSTGSRLP